MAGNSIQDNWRRINEQIAEAAALAGRRAADIQVVGVAKMQSLDRVEAAVRAGLRVVGENYAQELTSKKTALRHLNLKWHFVGHLQSNKVKNVVGEVALIHSVDRLSLAQKIGEYASTRALAQDILIEVNIDEEDSKNGVAIDQAPALIEEVQKVAGIRLCGLMCMPSLEKSPEESRRSFAQLRELRDQWRALVSPGKVSHHVDELSMGTTQDFRYAVMEGATLVRLGTILFGERAVRGASHGRLS
ncbi:MAG: YggS family pyridoxal phosphate-dependent enzyme [Bdellovibrionales bacterium]|nr:YggS family pyridoxal phosphate-dependent enzyme [Bdellovibrionales bacterium]